jgi:hypothetical protein
MGFVKLAEPGSEHTMHVKSVSVNTSGSWPEWEFTDGTDTLAVPQKAMERQLERLKMASALEMAGSTVKFSRSVKLGANKRPFWDVEIVNAAAANPQPSKRLPPPDAADGPYREIPKIPAFHVPAAERVKQSVPAGHTMDSDDRFAAFERELDAIEHGEGTPTERELAMENASLPQTPREQAQADQGGTDPLDALSRRYTDLYAKMLAGMLATHSVAASMPRQATRAPEVVPPVTAEAVNAATACVWIEAGKQGMLR